MYCLNVFEQDDSFNPNGHVKFNVKPSHWLRMRDTISELKQGRPDTSPYRVLCSPQIAASVDFGARVEWSTIVPSVACVFYPCPTESPHFCGFPHAWDDHNHHGRSRFSTTATGAGEEAWWMTGCFMGWSLIAMEVRVTIIHTININQFQSWMLQKWLMFIQR